MRPNIQIAIILLLIVLILHWNTFKSSILTSSFACDFFINKKCVFILLVESGRIALLEKDEFALCIEFVGKSSDANVCCCIKGFSLRRSTFIVTEIQ